MLLCYFSMFYNSVSIWVHGAFLPLTYLYLLRNKQKIFLKSNVSKNMIKVYKLQTDMNLNTKYTQSVATNSTQK